MAAKVIWLREAVADLGDIGSYIERNSPNYARIVVQRLYRTAMELPRFPGMGRQVPEWDDARYREKIVYNYRLVYRTVSPERIEVLAVIHGARLLPDVIRERGR
jgi:plasmid stabilization system protein ParE